MLSSATKELRLLLCHIRTASSSSYSYLRKTTEILYFVVKEGSPDFVLLIHETAFSIRLLSWANINLLR